MTDIKAYLKQYDGPALTLMEVCGTHTAAISRSGIPSMLSPQIRLISGPGCPVCVTVTAYIDRLIELSLQPGHAVVSFGDMLRVRGSRESLLDARARGGRVAMVYSPMDVFALAKKAPDICHVFAAVGFETTTPVYALLLQECIRRNVQNVKLLTALKTMPPVIDWLCAARSGKIDGFLAPGHVSVITGSKIFVPLAQKYHLPFVVGGFEGEEILAALYALVKLRGRGEVRNFYPQCVTGEGNRQAQALVSTYFEPAAASWRGIGTIEGSGLQLRAEYTQYDAGSRGLNEDREFNRQCRCRDVLVGAIAPNECPLFGSACTPDSPCGACMVSTEGSCFHYFQNRRGMR